MNKSGKRTRAVGMILFILLLSSFILTGCDVLGVAAYKLHGPVNVPAKYVPEKKPMLVLVENYQHQSSVNPHAELLAQMLVKELELHKIAPLVPLEKLQTLRDEKPDQFRTMSTSAIGRELGASQVLYVQLQRSDVTPLAGAAGGRDSLAGQTAATVKVVDVATGDTLWPGGAGSEAGHPVAASTQLGNQSGSGTAQDVRQRLYAQLSDEIARLFYKWQPEHDEPDGFQAS